MKANIHPAYFPEAVVTCACGNTFTVGSTKQTIRVEICSRCHPFYTGEQRIVDTAGQVERFMRRLDARRRKPGEEAGAAADQPAQSEATTAG